MRKSLIILFCCLGAFVQGQKIEVFGGINRNKFFDYKRDVLGHDETTYVAKYSNSFGIAIDSIMTKNWRWRVSLQYDQYKGDMTFSRSGAGGYSLENLVINNNAIGLAIYPFNFLVKGWEFNVGFTASALISEKYSGYRNWASTISGESGQEVFGTFKPMCAVMDFGVQYRVAKSIKLSKSLSLIPQGVVYQGLAKQYDFYPHHVMSKRKYLFIGLSYCF